MYEYGDLVEKCDLMAAKYRGVTAFSTSTDPSLSALSQSFPFLSFLFDLLLTAQILIYSSYLLSSKN